MDKKYPKCWNCNRLTMPWAHTTSQYVKDDYQGKWPEAIPPPGSFICGRCHSLVIEKAAISGGQLYHLIRSPKDLALILQLLTTIPNKPLDELLIDGIELNPGSFHKSEMVSLMQGILNGTTSETDLKKWGKEHGGWGCGSEADSNLILEKSMRILQYIPAWLATASRWDSGYRDVHVSTPIPYKNNNADCCVLRISAEWGIHGNFERGQIIVLPISNNRFLYFNGVEKWSRSHY